MVFGCFVPLSSPGSAVNAGTFSHVFKLPLPLPCSRAPFPPFGPSSAGRAGLRLAGGGLSTKRPPLVYAAVRSGDGVAVPAPAPALELGLELELELGLGLACRVAWPDPLRCRAAAAAQHPPRALRSSAGSACTAQHAARSSDSRPRWVLRGHGRGPRPRCGPRRGRAEATRRAPAGTARPGDPGLRSGSKRGLPAAGRDVRITTRTRSDSDSERLGLGLGATRTRTWTRSCSDSDSD
jgi:hypothetical protein